jgi:site-specific DNA recombinase
MRVAIYARVSTQNQAQDQTIELQIERLKAYVQEQQWTLLEGNIFRDDGYSGSKLNRPGLDQLRDKAAVRELDGILITAPDRLARNYVHQMVLLEEFTQHGCPVTFLDRPMSQDPHDQLLLQIRGAVAEYERTLITERMRRGKQSKYQAGTLLPWSGAPYGYQVDPAHPCDPAGVHIQEAEAAVVREIYAYYLQSNTSLYGVARHLHELQIPSPRGKAYWNTATVRGILLNPCYTGQVYANRTRTVKAQIRRSATHPIGRPCDSYRRLPEEAWTPNARIPQIISPEQYEQVKAKMSQNKQMARRNNQSYDYLLRALVSCGICAMSCTGRHAQEGYAYYMCRGKNTAIHTLRAQRCQSRFIPAKQVDMLVWQDICEVLTHPEIIVAAFQRGQNGAWLPQELQARRENLRKGQAALQNQLDRLTEAYLGEVIPLAEYQRRRKELEQRQQGLLDQEQQMTRQVDRQKELAGMQASVEAFSQRIRMGLETATFDQKRKLVELLIDRVVVRDGEVEIRYVIPLSPESEQIRFCHLRKDYHPPAVHLETDPAYLGTGKVHPGTHGASGMVESVLSFCPRA